MLVYGTRSSSDSGGEVSIVVVLVYGSSSSGVSV